MRLIIGADPAGYSLKEALKAHLTADEHEVRDVGVHYLPTGECMDPMQRHYPMVAEKVALEIAAGNYDFGIVCCGTGIGVSMAANKVPGVRAAAVSNYYEAKYTRLHNDANVLCLGGRVLAPEMACEIADLFLSTAFDGGERHCMRVDMLRELESRYLK